MPELGPLANSEFCASVSDFEDMFLTHLFVMLSGAGVHGLEDVVGGVAVELLELEGVLEFEWQPFTSMYFPKLLPLPCPPLMFEQPLVFLFHSPMNFDFCPFYYT